MKQKLPKIDLEIVKNIKGKNKFLAVNTHILQAHYEDRTASKTFKVDSVDRKNLDASVIIPYFHKNGELNVYLRSSLRPAVALKEIRIFPAFAKIKNYKLSGGVLWEFPAGLVEQNEPPASTAKRELKEEVGFDISVASFNLLGYSSYPCVGLCGEELFYYAVRVKPSLRKEPTLDGSVMEDKAVIEIFTLEQCFDMLRRGELKDAKTEIGLYRLVSFLNG